MASTAGEGAESEKVAEVTGEASTGAFICGGASLDGVAACCTSAAGPGADGVVSAVTGEVSTMAEAGKVPARTATAMSAGPAALSEGLSSEDSTEIEVVSAGAGGDDFGGCVCCRVVAAIAVEAGAADEDIVSGDAVEEDMLAGAAVEVVWTLPAAMVLSASAGKLAKTTDLGRRERDCSSEYHAFDSKELISTQYARRTSYQHCCVGCIAGGSRRPLAILLRNGGARRDCCNQQDDTRYLFYGT
jgi:hypothetical protein